MGSRQLMREAIRVLSKLTQTPHNRQLSEFSLSTTILLSNGYAAFSPPDPSHQHRPYQAHTSTRVMPDLKIKRHQLLLPSSRNPAKYPPPCLQSLDITSGKSINRWVTTPRRASFSTLRCQGGIWLIWSTRLLKLDRVHDWIKQDMRVVERKWRQELYELREGVENDLIETSARYDRYL